MEERIEIGIVSKAQGIKGEIKIAPLTDDDGIFNTLKSVYIGETLYKVQKANILVNGIFLKLDGVDDRNMAEFLKGRRLSIPKSSFKLPEGRYFIADLIGCDIVADGRILGVLTDILQHGSADVYAVRGERNFMFPALKEVLLSVDISTKRIELDSARLEEIAVYED